MRCPAQLGRVSNLSAAEPQARAGILQRFQEGQSGGELRFGQQAAGSGPASRPASSRPPSFQGLARQWGAASALRWGHRWLPVPGAHLRGTSRAPLARVSVGVAHLGICRFTEPLGDPRSPGIWGDFRACEEASYAPRGEPSCPRGRTCRAGTGGFRQEAAASRPRAQGMTDGLGPHGGLGVLRVPAALSPLVC